MSVAINKRGVSAISLVLYISSLGVLQHVFCLASGISNFSRMKGAGLSVVGRLDVAEIVSVRTG
jgi:hypothetical protein